jgi:hypothetical protein
MAITTAATQRYLQPFEGATGWGVFLPGDAPPHLATAAYGREERFAQRGVSNSIDRLRVNGRSVFIIGLGPRLGWGPEVLLVEFAIA